MILPVLSILIFPYYNRLEKNDFVYYSVPIILTSIITAAWAFFGAYAGANNWFKKVDFTIYYGDSEPSEKIADKTLGFYIKNNCRHPVENFQIVVSIFEIKAETAPLNQYGGLMNTHCVCFQRY